MRLHRGANPLTAVTTGPRDRSVLVASAIIAASALGAALAPGHPTDLAAIDLVYRVALVVAVQAAALRARPWAWVWAAVVTVMVARGWALAVAVAGVAATTAATLLSSRAAGPARTAPGRHAAGPAPRTVSDAQLVAGVGVALSVQVLLRLGPLGPHGWTALVAAVAVVPVLVSGVRHLATRPRRLVTQAGLVLAGVTAVLVLPVAVAGVQIWFHAGDAQTETTAWLDAARQGDQPATLAHLDRAAAAFDRTHQAADAWWLGPSRLVPTVSQYLSAARASSAAGGELSQASRGAAAVANLSQLRLSGGRIDLTTLKRLRDPMATTRDVARRLDEQLSATDAGWLLPPMANRFDRVRATVHDARRESDLAVDALDVAPGLLGGDGTKTWFVIFASPAESRELGGFMGNYGLLTAEGGKLTLTRTGRTGDLNDTATRLGVKLDTASLPPSYAAYDLPRFWQNLSGTIDFPTVGRTVATMVPQVSGTAIDGVLYADPAALAALMRLTGPVAVPGLTQPLTADTTADFLLRGQYEQFPDLDARIDFLDRVSRTTFERLTTGDLPGPQTVADALGPVVSTHHLLAWSPDGGEEALFTRLGLDGAVVPTSGTDVVEVTEANGNPNKLDAYLHRTVHYAVTADRSTGDVQATATVTLHSTPPANLSSYVAGNEHGLPAGTTRTLVGLSSAYGLSKVEVDGQSVSVHASEEYGRHRYDLFVVIPAGGTVTVTFALDGQEDPAQGYRLALVTPAVANPDDVSIVITERGGGSGLPATEPRWLTPPDGPAVPFNGSSQPRPVSGGVLTVAPRS